jgi:fructosamine-3-kinase
MIFAPLARLAKNQEDEQFGWENAHTIGTPQPEIIQI